MNVKKISTLLTAGATFAVGGRGAGRGQDWS
jgi:hypothetical protein